MKKIILGLLFLPLHAGAMYVSAPNAPQIRTTPSGQTSFTVNLSSFMASPALSGTFANTSPALTAIALSTITLDLTGTQYSRISVEFNGAMSNGNLAAATALGILVDGALVNGETAAKLLTSDTEQVIGNNNNMSFHVIVTGLSATQHNICLVGFVSAGTTTIDSTNSVAKFSAYVLP